MHLRRFVGSLAAQDEDYPLVAARQHMSALWVISGHRN